MSDAIVSSMAAPGAPAVRAVLFDLDGTLLDTAPDLAFALNRVLEASARQPLPYGTIRPWVSHGAQSLIRHGFGITPDHPDFELRRRQLLTVYQNHIAVETRLFPGMPELLDTLEKRGIGWGVVTNKPAFLTEPLMRATGLAGRAACIVSGDTTPFSKPHPEPLRHACRVIGSPCAEALYVGDARRDIEAGVLAGMQTLVALFGYLGEDDDPASWGADGMVREPGEILSWMPPRHGNGFL